MPASFAVNSGGDAIDSNWDDGIAWTGAYLPGPGMVKEVTLRAAIQQANALGVFAGAHAITFAPPIPPGPPAPPPPGGGMPQNPITVMLTRPMDDIRVNLEITGNGKNSTTLTRDATAGNFPLFSVATTPGLVPSISVRFNSLTIKGGRGGEANGAPGNMGGAINNAADLLLYNVDVRDNRAWLGGGIHNATSGVLTLWGCVLADNHAAGAGADGGAIYTTGGGRVSINDSILSGNSATSKGGAIHLNVQSRVALFNTSLSNNTAAEGGAVHASVGQEDALPFQMRGGRVWNNTAARGGAFYFSTTNAKLDGVFIDNNSASDSGGAVFQKMGELQLIGCTFEDNSAVRFGPHLTYVGTLGMTVWITRTNCPTLPDAALIEYVPVG